MKVLVTGASGAIGSVLRPGLRAAGLDVAGLDQVPPADADPAVTLGDCADLATVERAAAGAEAFVHLAGIASESALPDILASHVVTTACVLEASRRHGIRRVVYASSNHAVGFAPRVDSAPGDLRHRPDTFYGVGKVAAEGLMSLYADRHGVSGVSLRIGSFLPRPTSVRHLSTWLSHDDAVRLVLAALTGTVHGHVTVWGVSANTRGWWDLSSARALGYTPADDAERYAQDVAATPEDVAHAAHVGGDFATAARDRSPFG